MTSLLCASVMFIQSGHIPEPYPAFDIYWQDYNACGEVRRLHAVTIGENPKCAVMTVNRAPHPLPDCDTFMLIGDDPLDVMALRQSLSDYKRLKVMQ